MKNKSFLESEVVVKIKDILSKGSQLSNYLLVEIVDDELVDCTSKYNEIKNNVDKLNIKINNNNREISDLSYKINYLEESINNGGNLPASIKAILNNPKFSGIENIG